MANHPRQRHRAASPRDGRAAGTHAGTSHPFARHRRKHHVLLLREPSTKVSRVCASTVFGTTVVGVVDAAAATGPADPDAAVGAVSEVDVAVEADRSQDRNAQLRLATPETVQLMLPERRLHEQLLTTRLRHLSLGTSQRKWTGSLPPLTRLRTLQIAVHRGSPQTNGSSWPLVDLSLLTELEQLHVQGDIWSRVQETFTGVSHTIRCCLLRGPLVVGTRPDDFFGRIATGLQSLFCQGTHVVGQLRTDFPQLAFLALHQTVQRPGVFLCPHATIRAISIEADDSYGRDRVEDLNMLLQLVLDHTLPTLRLLALRSGLSCILTPETLHRFPLMQHRTAVVLDGAIVMDQPLPTSGTGNFTPPRITVTIDSWLQSGGRTSPSPPNAMNHLTQLDTADSPMAPPQRCRCGHWDRELAFDHAGVDRACFDMYAWLIADPRAPVCGHRRPSR
ncbi:hypothetical protein LTR70_009412 [Exophiala xenobiotica]|uniref:Uncharacterized protein n=1 Tax=Lithohypha guttulata TaxID=1690604 RepID=A0ABR0JXD0_9EURO|nr:hypothetical protein LTR24_009309 [Lithohypha guttulata]KAK5310549.1 hypothetical protein LTR70_009412 [Exophiala xenobiotica]